MHCFTPKRITQYINLQKGDQLSGKEKIKSTLIEYKNKGGRWEDG